MSNNVFSNLNADGAERNADNVGKSGFSVYPTNVYEMQIKYAYTGTSMSSKAMSVTIVGNILNYNGSNTNPYSETLWITNKDGLNYSMSKDNKKKLLTGFQTLDDICCLATGKHLSQQGTVDKIIEKYDYDTKSMQKASVPVIEGLIDKKVTVAISQIKDFKRKKFDDGYKTINDFKDSNRIEKVFANDKHLTVNEILNKVESSEFYNTWLEKHKGKVQDRTKDKKPEVILADNNTGSSASPDIPSAEGVPTVDPFGA